MKKRIYYIPFYEVDVPYKPKFTWKQFWKDAVSMIIPLSVLTIVCIVIMVVIYYIIIFGQYLYELL